MKKISNLFLIFLIFLCTGCTSECLHEKETIEEVKSTCIENGYKITYCSICDKEFKVELPLGEHQFKDSETIQELSYTKPEIKKCICELCNEQETITTSYDDITNRSFVLEENRGEVKFNNVEDVLRAIERAVLWQDDQLVLKGFLDDEQLNTLRNNYFSYNLTDTSYFSWTWEYEKDGRLVYEFEYLKNPLIKPTITLYSKFLNVNKIINEEKRKEDFNEFYIDSVSDTMEVETTFQLANCLSKGIRPICKEGSNASVIYEMMRDILRNIINDNMSDYEKIQAIHDYICENVSYDYDLYYNGGSPKYSESGWLEGVFFNKQAVCGAFADTFTSMCNIEGIICVTVKGSSKTDPSGHAWNKVYLDGNWYVVDTTFDIMTVKIRTLNELTSYTYFLTSETRHLKEYDVYVYTNIPCNQIYNKYAQMKYIYQGEEHDFVIESYEEFKNVIAYYESVKPTNTSVSIFITYEYDGKFESELRRVYFGLQMVNDSYYKEGTPGEWVILN